MATLNDLNEKERKVYMDARRAYCQEIRKYHPDKIDHLGPSHKHLLELAAEQTIKLNAEWDELETRLFAAADVRLQAEREARRRSPWQPSSTAQESRRPAEQPSASVAPAPPPPTKEGWLTRVRNRILRFGRDVLVLTGAVILEALSWAFGLFLLAGVSHCAGVVIGPSKSDVSINYIGVKAGKSCFTVENNASHKLDKVELSITGRIDGRSTRYNFYLPPSESHNVFHGWSSQVDSDEIMNADASREMCLDGSFYEDSPGLGDVRQVDRVVDVKAEVTYAKFE